MNKRKLLLSKTITTVKIMPAIDTMPTVSKAGPFGPKPMNNMAPKVKTEVEYDKSIINVDAVRFNEEFSALLSAKLNEPSFFHNCVLNKVASDESDLYCVNCTLCTSGSQEMRDDETIIAAPNESPISDKNKQPEVKSSFKILIKLKRDKKVKKKSLACNTNNSSHRLVSSGKSLL